MATLSDHGVRSSPALRTRPFALYERWVDRYGALVAEQLESDRLYTLVRIGAAEFAFTRYERYVAALGQAWKAGLVPEALPSARGAELPDAAPNLRGVDPDLSDLRRSEVEPQRRFI
jgi:hypothetical protein